MRIGPRNLVTAPIKPGSKKGTTEFCEKNFTLNAQFDFDLKLCALPLIFFPAALRVAFQNL